MADADEIALGPSLREVQSERFKVDGRQSLSVLVYAAKLAEDASVKEVAELHGELAREAMKRSAAPMSGILLLQRGAALHLLEAAPEFLGAFMRALDAHPETQRLMDAVSVVVKLEDRPWRLFGEWSMHTVSTAPEAAAAVAAEDLVDASQAVLQALTQIGEQMADAGKAAGPEFSDRFHELVPSAERTAQMAGDEGYMSLREYMGFFESPVDIDFDREAMPVTEMVHVP